MPEKRTVLRARRPEREGKAAIQPACTIVLFRDGQDRCGEIVHGGGHVKPCRGWTLGRRQNNVGDKWT